MAATSLDFERSGIAQFAWNRRSLEELARLAMENGIGGRRPGESPVIRRRMAELWAANEAGRMVAYKVGWMQSRKLVPNTEASWTAAPPPSPILAHSPPASPSLS